MSEGVDSVAASVGSVAPTVPMPETRRRDRAGWTAVLGLIAFAAIWLAHLSYTSLSPPTDNIEQLTWVHSLEWGYYKHPPLPTWLIWAPAQVFGANAWTSYATGAALTLGSMGLLWRLLSRLRGQRYAALALLATLCVTYYNGRLYYYNHNVVLMFCATASLLLCWKAHTTRQLRWWAALGIALGLGALAKYQVAVTMAAVLAFWLQQRGWRDARQRAGLLLATSLVVLIFAPHLLWLRTHDFGPVEYAMQSSLGARLGTEARWVDSLHWLADQLLNRAIPAWLLLSVAVYAARGRAVPWASAATAMVAPKRDGAGRALLLIWGLVPLAFMPAVGIFAGADLQLQWGTPFLLFAVPAAMELLHSRTDWTRVPLRPALHAFVGIQALLLILSHITSPRGPEALRDRHWRAFDSEALAKVLEEPAQAALAGGHICVVSGPGAPAGALALKLADRPMVLINGRFDQSPWVSALKVRDCGMLELREGQRLPGDQAVGKEFPNLSWRIVQPASTTWIADARKRFDVRGSSGATH
jgi:4-amino-4-deoxy-L-arabinose transferase-like glycosyltransferase